MRLVIAALALTLTSPLRLAAQDYTVVFEGRPIRKVEVTHTAELATSLSADAAFKYAVRIVQRNGRLFWATRDMLELQRVEAGGYITYFAVNGSGYVRTFIPLMLDMRDALPAAQRRSEIGYTEHLLTQFASITYFGNRLGAK